VGESEGPRRVRPTNAVIDVGAAVIVRVAAGAFTA
jgi:hypothetical protein